MYFADEFGHCTRVCPAGQDNSGAPDFPAKYAKKPPGHGTRAAYYLPELYWSGVLVSMIVGGSDTQSSLVTSEPRFTTLELGENEKRFDETESV